MNKASIIISFYNRIDQLKLIIAALEQQTCPDFDVIISDDGSNEEAVKQLKEIMENSKLTIQHVWHPDNGFNKTKILNKSIVASNSAYIIFIDGDCIPAFHFVEDHLKYAKKNRVLAGRRVELSDEMTKEINEDYVHSKAFKNLWIKALLNSFSGKTRKAEEGFRIANNWINETFGSSKKGILGCNFSLHREVLLQINGFDERYIHPAVGEDTEIKIRLLEGGYEIFKPKFAMVQFHLWHKRQSRAGEKENLVLLEETIQNKYVKTPYGIYKE